MLQIIQFLVFYMVLPLIYLTVGVFDFILIARASTLKHRWQALGGAISGFLISTIIILLDLSFGGLVGSVIPPQTANDVWPAVVIMTVIGFFLLLFIDLLIHKGVIPFTIMFTVAGLIVSGYYLLTLTQIRTSTAVGAIGFLLGAIIYFMMFPTRIVEQLKQPAGVEEQ